MKGIQKIKEKKNEKKDSNDLFMWIKIHLHLKQSLNIMVRKNFVILTKAVLTLRLGCPNIPASSRKSRKLFKIYSYLIL